MKRKSIFKSLTLVGVVSLVLLTAMLASLVGCDQPEAETLTTTQTEVETATETEVERATATETETETEVVEPIVIVFSIHDQDGSSWAEIYDPYFEAIEERTNGGIIIEDHWGGELVGFFESYAACADGTVDMTQSQVQMYGDLFPLEDCYGLTSYNISPCGRAQLFQELYEITPEIQQAFTDSNTKLLFKVSAYPAYAVFREGAGVKTLADFEGKKFLTTSPYDSLKWEALGLVPLSMMPDETFMNIQTGVCDGVFFTLATIWEFGMQDILHTIVETNFAGGVFSMVMNLDTWNSLPAEYQQIIMEESAKIPALQDPQQQRIDEEYKQIALDAGYEYITLSQAELDQINATLDPIREMWVEQVEDMGLPGQRVLDNILELEQKYACP